MITKNLIVKCGQYSFLGFRFGPKVIVRIEVCYHQCGKFTATITEGPRVRNFEKVYKKEIEATQQEIVRDLTFIVRRKQLIEQYETKKFKKIETDKIHRSLEKAAFDELTDRMRKKRDELDPHPCLIKKPTVLVKDEEVKNFQNYFGDTTKIVNRRTRND
jgi:hypothetical protein